MTSRRKNFRIWVSIFTVMLFAVPLKAQTYSDAVETFNAGADEVTAGNFEAAIEKFEASYEMATALGAEGDEVKKMAMEQIPNLYYRISIDKYKAKDYPGAITSFEETVTASEKYGNDDVKGKSLAYIPQLCVIVGNSQYSSGEYEAALASYDKAIEYIPGYARAMYGKAMVYRKQEKTDEMISTLEQTFEAGNSQGDEKTAEAAAKTLKDYFMNQGKIAFNAADFDNAMSNFQTSFKYDPENPEAYYLICVIHDRLGELDEAVEAGLQALEYEEDDADKQARIYYELGNIYTSLVEYDKACDAYSHALVGSYEANARRKMEDVLNCQ